MHTAQTINPLAEKVSAALTKFTTWLDRYGETSWDHQSFYSGPFGQFAKRLYYTHKLPGTAAVAPMIFCEAFLPDARRLFHQRIRLPIADAHYAMGFAFLYESTGVAAHLERAVHFLDVLENTRCPKYQDYAWGYPFDWVTRFLTITSGTPLITTTPYVFEAFLQVNQLQASEKRRKILESITRHVHGDYKDFKFSDNAMTCSYTPDDEGKIVNASAYRAFTLVSAANYLGREDLLAVAERNINFVLATQKPDGSWPYAVDGVRDFVDHFHTCFVMKALAKIYQFNGNERIHDSLKKGLNYYLKNLFSETGMPRPFSKAPRMTVYQCELYDCAECINLCVLLRKDFPQLEKTMATVISQILDHWVKADGSFRSRKLKFGWDNVPMHRWAQSQMFRALAFYALDAQKNGKS